MVKAAEAESALGGYRVLDLTDEKGLLCGKILGDLGADVIKIEKPGEDSAGISARFTAMILTRRRAYSGWAYNVNKRGITLDIETQTAKKFSRAWSRPLILCLSHILQDIWIVMI